MRTILTLGILMSLATPSFGQGLIQFKNKSGSTVDARIYIEVSPGVSVACSGADTTIRAALLGGPATGTAYKIGGGRVDGNLSMLANPNSGNTWVNFLTTAAGVGYVNVGSDAARDSKLPYGSTGLFQIAVWQGYYDTWADAWAAAWSGGNVRIGLSNPVLSPVTTGPSDQNIPLLIGLQSFTIDIPEPSTFALAGLGTAVLLISRRRT